MQKTFSVGDDVRLPSGRYVRIVCAASVSRPWQAVETGYVWHVCRPHQDPAQTGASYYFDPAKPTPLQLEETDARALTAALNSVRATARSSRY